MLIRLQSFEVPVRLRLLILLLLVRITLLKKLFVQNVYVFYCDEKRLNYYYNYYRLYIIPLKRNLRLMVTFKIEQIFSYFWSQVEYLLQNHVFNMHSPWTCFSRKPLSRKESFFLRGYFTTFSKLPLSPWRTNQSIYSF